MKQQEAKALALEIVKALKGIKPGITLQEIHDFGVLREHDAALHKKNERVDRKGVAIGQALQDLTQEEVG